MSTTREALLEHLTKIRQTFKQEETDIEMLLAALDKQEAARANMGAKSSAAVAGKNGHKNPMPINDAIIQAVNNGQQTPVSVFQYLEKIGVITTIKSVNTRLSKLKTAKRIAHNGTRWIPAKKSGPEPASSGP